MSDALQAARALDERELMERASALARSGRAATAGLVAAVAELELRDLHLRQGYSSLFGYCREALALAEQDAYRVVAAARVARRFPVVLELLAAGALTLTSVQLLGPCLTEENHRALLAAARGLRRSQVEELVALHRPEADAPPELKLLAPGVSPLSAQRYRIQLTIGQQAVEKLRLARDMLRHSLPAGDDAAVLERALGALLVELARKKFAATERPRPAGAAALGSRHVPAEVKREVWLRDLGCCAFVAASGRRCRERGFVEFHHVKPYAAGGEASAANLELRCRRHNAYEAREYFGGTGVREPRAAYLA